MSSEVITWDGRTASYTPEEKALMPKTVREAKFIHELKARFGGTLSEGSPVRPRAEGSSASLMGGTAPAFGPGRHKAPSESVLFPIPERARVLLELMEDVK